MVFYIVICFWSCNVSFIICEFISGMIKYFVVIGVFFSIQIEQTKCDI